MNPTYENQNRFLDSYVAPILLDADIGQVIENINKNSREAKRKRKYEIKKMDDEQFLEESEKAGVFKSLRKLENFGTSFDRIMHELRRNIKGTKEYEEYEKILKECSDMQRLNLIYEEIIPPPQIYMNKYVSFLKSLKERNEKHYRL